MTSVTLIPLTTYFEGSPTLDLPLVDTDVFGIVREGVLFRISGVDLVASVENNAALVLLTSTTATVYRAGFTTPGDGGGAVYTWTSASCSINAGAGDNGSQIPTVGGGSWRLSPMPYYDVRIWGAKCDGSANDTNAVNAAIASGLSPIFIPGVCNVTHLNAPPTNTRITGISQNVSIIKTTSATGDVLPLTNGGVIIDHIGFGSTVTRTGGYYIHFQANSLTLEHFAMNDAWGAFAVDDGTHSVRIDDGFIFDSKGGGQAVTLWGSGTGTGPLAAYFGHTLFNSGTPTNTNISVVNLGDVLIDNIQSLSSTVDLGVTPGSGQNVDSLSVVDSFLDHGTTGLLMAPTGTGSIARAHFVNTWFGSLAGNGANLDGGTGTASIDGVDFINCQFLLNGGSGLAVQGRVKNISVIGGYVAENDIGIFDSRSVGFDGFIVKGVQIGAGNGLGENTTAGISRGNAGDYFLAQGNDMHGQATSPYVNANIGTRNFVMDNVGYNPLGNIVVTPGVSPWTYVNNEGRSTYYSFGGTISTIQVNGVTLFATAGNPWVIPLEPNDYVITFYTVAPEVNVQRH